MLELQTDLRVGDSGKAFDAAYDSSVASTLPTTVTFSRGSISSALLRQANRYSPRLSFLETGGKVEQSLVQAGVSALVLILLFDLDRGEFLGKRAMSLKMSSNVGPVIFGAIASSRKAAEG